MKFFSQGPVSWFDFGVATVVMVVIVAGIFTYRVVVPPSREAVCGLKNTPKGNTVPEKQIQVLCEKYRMRNPQTH